MQQCTVEIFKSGWWQECCTVTLDNPATGRSGPSFISYNQDYLFDGKQAPSLLYRPQAARMALPCWPSFLLDLIPQGEGRQYLQEVLELEEAPESDWRMLLIGAINPVGQLRVREAVDAYWERMRQLDLKWVTQGFSTADVLSRSEGFVEHFDAHGLFTGGATSVQGMAPKFLLTQGKDSLWYADATLPDDKAAKHYILKFSRARNMADWVILKHEAAYMRLAHEMGLFVAELPEWKNDMLFVPRFDRSVMPERVIRHQQESLASLSALVDPLAVPTHNLMLKTLRLVVDDPYQATLEYIRRDVMNLALGNTDNGPYNIAVQTVNGEIRLTPLYDFAPTYLETDNAGRALEWVNENGDEISNWADVLRALPLSPEEKDKLRGELRAFGERMAALETLMEAHGVSNDIMTDRYYGIQNQRWQLREL
ncbi:MAG: HipA domain-containing protein [Burkholderiaceae bacterium]|jgi:serine/threonine-protein kinase HipA|nr:HipA domain-containing protein [Burkholderiaceae bacterium]